MNDKIDKKYARLFTKDEFAALTRDGMYQALLHVSPTLARGKSRAKKEELIDAYQTAADTDSIPVLEVKKDAEGNAVAEPLTVPSSGGPDGTLVDRPPVTAEETYADIADAPEPPPDDYSPAEARLSEHIHGPDCNHDHELPKLAGMDDFVRVNPEMPSMPITDGQILQLPPDPGELMFTFKDGNPRMLTEKEQHILNRLQREFEAFQANPANSDAKKSVLADIYALKNLGIIANPKFVETIKAGRDHVRDVRRKWKLGVDVPEILKEGRKESKLDTAVSDALKEG